MGAIKNKSNYEFSIILPFQNDVQYIKECLDSIANQQHNNVEVICINLNSSDETEQLISKYAKKKSYIKLIDDKKTTNINEAYNLGLSLAHGKYIKLADPRSVFYKLSFSLLFNMMNLEQTSFAIHTQSYLFGNDYLTDASWDWIRFTPTPTTIYTILPHCLEISHLCDSVAFSRQLALDNNVLFDENSDAVDDSQFFKLMFLSQNVSLVYQDIVRHTNERNFSFGNKKNTSYLSKLTDNMCNVFDKHCILPIYKGQLIEHLISRYAQSYKMTSISQRPSFLKDVRNELDKIHLTSNDINNLSAEAKFNYGCFFSGNNCVYVSIVLVCKDLNNFVTQYVTRFLRSNNMFAELLIVTLAKKHNAYLDELCELSDFVNISYVTDIDLSFLSSIRGKYILFQNEHNIFWDNLYNFYAYAIKNDADVLFGVEEYGSYVKAKAEQIYDEYLKYTLSKFTYLNIYSNRLLDLLYHESQQLYKTEYLQVLAKNALKNTNVLLNLPLVATLNSKSLMLYNIPVTIYQTNNLSQSQLEILNKTFYQYTHKELKDWAKYDQLLYRFKVSSQEHFARKLTGLERQYQHKLEQYKIKPEPQNQEVMDRIDIENSPLWDENFYLSQFDYSAYNIDVSPVEHYSRKGWKEGYLPSPYFNGKQYAEHYGLKDKNPLAYFIQQGRFRYKGFLDNPYQASEESIKNYWKNKKKNHKVIYMCITGDYDKLEELSGHFYINPEWDYVCFTDNKEHLKKKIVGIWQTRKLQYNKSDNTRNNRWHKVFPHILFPEYDESIYMDSNINVLTPFLYEEIKKRDMDLLLPKHAGNFSIYHEYDWALRTLVDKPELIMSACEEIMNTGFPFFYSMPECNIIYRRHKSKLVKTLMDEWWYWIKTYAKRDQLSFSFLLWKHHISVQECTFVNARIDYKDFCVFAHPVDRKKRENKQ